MRVALLAYLMHSGSDYRAAGVSTYIRQLLAHLPAAQPANEYIVFHGADAPAVAGTRSVLSPVPTVRAPLRIGWEQFGYPLQARRLQPDVVHGTVNVLPLLGSTPSVVTVHDLTFLRHRERFPRRKAMYLRAAVQMSVRRAHRVVAVSESTRHDLIDLLGVPPESVEVIYPGVDCSFRRLPPAEVAAFRGSVFAGRPYILHVGTLEPRKNIDVLLRAFADLRAREDLPHQLALIGARGWMYEPLLALVETLGLSDHVSFLDYVAPASLPLWYNGADLFAYPSAYEGFGLPVVEAMACGAPAITSSSSSLGELAAGAALTVETGSVESLAMGMRSVLTNPDRAGCLREAGVARAATFSWERAASATVKVYERVAGRAW